MASHILTVQSFGVNEQTDVVLCVIHQSKNADRAGMDIQISDHEFFLCEGEPRRADLSGKDGCAELFVVGKKKQIKFGFLCIA